MTGVEKPIPNNYQNNGKKDRRAHVVLLFIVEIYVFFWKRTPYLLKMSRQITYFIKILFYEIILIV